MPARYVPKEAFVRAARGKRSKYLIDNEFVKSIKAVCISYSVSYFSVTVSSVSQTDKKIFFLRNNVGTQHNYCDIEL